jgi:hypothetical protein
MKFGYLAKTKKKGGAVGEGERGLYNGFDL